MKSFKQTGILSIIIPFFNEENELNSVVEDINKFEEKKSRLILEYLFINDASNDDSINILTKLVFLLKKKIKKKIKIIHNPKHIGYCKTVIKGYNLAKAKYLLVIPGDGEAKLCQFIARVEFNKDIIVIQRSSMANRPSYRKLISWIYKYFISFLFSVKLIDFNGLIVVKREKIKLLSISSESYFISAETIIKSFKLGLNIGYKNYFKLFPKNKYKSSSLSLRQFIKVTKDIFITLKFVRLI
jgi:glycosyltransferase involved in cell wall biosynthesis